MPVTIPTGLLASWITSARLAFAVAHVYDHDLYAGVRGGPQGNGCPFFTFVSHPLDVAHFVFLNRGAPGGAWHCTLDLSLG